jgi:hypothetical protein
MTQDPRLYICRFSIFDIDIDYDFRPNEDIYQEIVPKELKLSVVVPYNFDDLTFEEQKALLKDEVITTLAEQVLFDTPDDPDFSISDVNFCFEVVTD